MILFVCYRNGHHRDIHVLTHSVPTRRSAERVMTGHVQGVAKDSAAIEAVGANPDHTFRMLRDRAYQQMVEANPVEKGKVDNRAASRENLYNLAAGKTEPVANPRVAQFFDGLRSLLVASRLGSRSEERRVGKECDSTGRSRLSEYH